MSALFRVLALGPMLKPKRLMPGLVAGLMLTLAGCASEPVQPWQKEHLARPDMNPEADPAAVRFLEHIYFSREGTSGGAGIGGGGCGCN